MLEGFPQAISVSNFDLGHSRIVEHSVELTDSQPFRDRYNEVRDHFGYNETRWGN